MSLEHQKEVPVDLDQPELERAYREGRGSLKVEIFKLIENNESPDLLWLRRKMQEL